MLLEHLRRRPQNRHGQCPIGAADTPPPFGEGFLTPAHPNGDSNKSENFKKAEDCDMVLKASP